MPLPADFPQPPQRPPSGAAMVGPDGKVTKEWSNFFDRLGIFNARVRARLDTL